MNAVGTDDHIGFDFLAVGEFRRRTPTAVCAANAGHIEVDGGGRHQPDQQLMKIRPVSHHVGRTEALLHNALPWMPISEAGLIPGDRGEACRFNGQFGELVEDAQGPDHLDRIGAHLQPEADFAEARGALVNGNLKAMLVQSCRSRHATDTAADHGHTHCPVLQPVSPLRNSLVGAANR